MKTLGLTDVIGPIMVGPSSSHTAGALRIAYMARRLCLAEPKTVEFRLLGSFAHTLTGHGTDKALVAGMLGLATDDLRIRDSFDLAREAGPRVLVRHAARRGVRPSQHHRRPHCGRRGQRDGCARREHRRRRGRHPQDRRHRRAHHRREREHRRAAARREGRAGPYRAEHQRRGREHRHHAHVPRAQGRHRLHRAGDRSGGGRGGEGRPSRTIRQTSPTPWTRTA